MAVGYNPNNEPFLTVVSGVNLNLTFDELVNRYMSDMYATAIRLTRSRQLAEDLVHDLFVTIREQAIPTDHVKNPRAWLASILYRRFVDGWRRDKRSPIRPIDDCSHQAEYEQAITLVDADPMWQCQLDDETQSLLQAVEQLSEDQRQIIVLHDVEGYTLVEIQQMSGTALGTLKSRLHRAREKLYQILSVQPGSLRKVNEM